MGRSETVFVWVVTCGFKADTLDVDVFRTRREAMECAAVHKREIAGLVPVGRDEWRNASGMHLRVRRCQVRIPM